MLGQILQDNTDTTKNNPNTGFALMFRGENEKKPPRSFKKLDVVIKANN